ncbi:hypothetical protein ACFJGW_03620 [Burkholderiaceae bacterium UC74_6]
MTSRFNTLLLREWMQHKRGWLVTLLVPPALFLVMLPFNTPHNLPPEVPSLAIGVVGVMATTAIICLISAISAAFQMPGLARRDVQDRSIEFWLSLPASHAESIGVTLLTHLLLVPLGIAAAAYGIGYLMAAAMALKMGGFGLLTSVSWGGVVGFTLPLLLRLMLGVVLGLLWLAPLVMIFMNASAWLKRWGVPAVAASAVVLLAIVPKVYDITIFRDLLHAQWGGFVHSFVYNVEVLKGEGHQAAPELLSETARVTAWVWQDSLGALQALANPHFIGGLAFAALGFWLLMLRRRRGA